MGSSDVQTVRAFIEAEAYDGPSLIIAYSHCIAHGINMTKGLEQQKLAVDTGYWPLYRYNPEMALHGENPLKIESKEPKIPFRTYAYNETRYKMLTKIQPEAAKDLIEKAQQDVNDRWHFYQGLAAINYSNDKPEEKEER
jgi:pyruvate-ferredoxin/flavodoxin oxidoreductase